MTLQSFIPVDKSLKSCSVCFSKSPSFQKYYCTAMTADNMTADNMTAEGELGADSPMFTAAALTLIVLAVFQVHWTWCDVEKLTITDGSSHQV